jgi:hypothetical protein
MSAMTLSEWLRTFRGARTYLLNPVATARSANCSSFTRDAPMSAQLAKCRNDFGRE